MYISALIAVLRTSILFLLRNIRALSLLSDKPLWSLWDSYFFNLALLAFFSVSQVSADWGDSSTYPYIWTYRKTSLFSVSKLDSNSATYSLPYIAPYSLTATGVSAHPAKIYFRLVTDPNQWDPAYDSYLHAYDFNSVDPGTYWDYYNAVFWRSS